MTHPTSELAELVLLDSAKLQQEDAENANKHNYTKHHPAKPLYTIEDAKASFKHFEPSECNVFIRLSDRIIFALKHVVLF